MRIWPVNAVVARCIELTRRPNYGAMDPTRRFSTTPVPRNDPGFIILSPVQAGLVKVKPRRLQKRRRSPAPESVPPTTYLDNLNFEDKDSEPVVLGIHSQRPETTSITSQRYHQITKELVKGFRKEHLEEYLTTQRVQPSVFRKMTKKKMAEYIMSQVWQTSIKDAQGTLNEVGTPMVENVIDLSEEEFVLVLGNNGRLLREWSKSGAKISILPARFQIIVSSTPETFEWINASLGLFLESLVQREVDLTRMHQGMHAYLDKVSSENDLLTVMQRLTNTFFRTNSDGLVVYSAGRASAKNFELVRRLLLQVSQRFIDHQWRPAQWLFDTNAENLSRYRFRPFNDTDSLEWMDRIRPWWRWEAVKYKSSGISTKPTVHTAELRALAPPEFGGGETDPGQASTDTSGERKGEPSLTEQVHQAIEQLVTRTKGETPTSLNNASMSTTLTVTPGFILHNQSSLAGVPNAGTKKTFTSNIPYVANLASSLPMFSKDMHHEGMREDGSLTSKSENDPEATDNWASILNLDGELDSEGRKVFVSRHKELDFVSNLRLIQMKFVVDPQEEHADEFPPIEAWAELPPISALDNTRLEQVPRILAVPLESNAYISLPNHKADLKITCAQTYPIAVTEAIEQYFLKGCKFGRLGALEVRPEIEIEFGPGKKANYKYHSTSYVTLAELEFRGQMMQFSQAEGGKLGGRKIEASITSHAEGELPNDEIQSAASNALELASRL